MDVYIDCANKVQVFHYGRGVLQAYIPTLIRGRNVIKNIKEDGFGSDIFDVEETDSEVLFKFKSTLMKDFEKYLKPKTSGSNISPFSSKNLPKNLSYSIPVEDLVAYQNIIEIVPQKQRISLAHMTNIYIKSLAKNKTQTENIKLDMKKKGLRGKEYIHSIGEWNRYLKFLEKQIKESGYVGE